MEFISIGGLLPGLLAEDIRSGISQPRIEVTHNTFKLVLPNMNADEAEETVPAADNSFTVTPQIKTVMDYLAEYGEMTDEELQDLLNIKKTRAYLIAREMNENGLIDITGRGRKKKYRLKNRTAAGQRV